jgi:hypothetical protein
MDIIEQKFREIVREEIASCGILPTAPDPELIDVAETVTHLNGIVTAAVIYNLHKERAKNGFPSVQLGQRTIAVDKRRLNAWVASGGLEMGVKS